MKLYSSHLFDKFLAPAEILQTIGSVWSLHHHLYIHIHTNSGDTADASTYLLL